MKRSVGSFSTYRNRYIDARPPDDYPGVPYMRQGLFIRRGMFSDLSDQAESRLENGLDNYKHSIWLENGLGNYKRYRRLENGLDSYKRSRRLENGSDKYKRSSRLENGLGNYKLSSRLENGLDDYKRPRRLVNGLDNLKSFNYVGIGTRNTYSTINDWHTSLPRLTQDFNRGNKLLY